MDTGAEAWLVPQEAGGLAEQAQAQQDRPGPPVQDLQAAQALVQGRVEAQV